MQHSINAIGQSLTVWMLDTAFCNWTTLSVAAAGGLQSSSSRWGPHLALGEGAGISSGDGLGDPSGAAAQQLSGLNGAVAVALSGLNNKP